MSECALQLPFDDGLDDGLGDERILIYHADSDCYLVVYGRDEFNRLVETSWEELIEVTGIPRHEQAFAQQSVGANDDGLDDDLDEIVSERIAEQVHEKLDYLDSGLDEETASSKNVDVVVTYDPNDVDFYPTPQYVVDDFLSALNAKTGILTNIIKHSFEKGAYVLDPCAGGLAPVGDFNRSNVIKPAPYVEGLVKAGVPRARIQSCDIREDADAIHRGYDFVANGAQQQFFKYDGRPRLITSNPPFNFAQEFVDQALEAVDDMGYVAFLLRLNFLGSQKRKDWWLLPHHRPYGIFIHSKRPSFREDGKTDSIEYAHYLWWKNPNIKQTFLEWI